MASRLPTECWEEIFKDLDIHSLHTAILINRTSFIAGIGILWSNPFEIFRNSKLPKHGSKLIDIYLSYLSQESKDKILGLSIIDKIPTMKTFFSYASLLRTLPLPYMDRAISKWLEENDDTLKEGPDSTEAAKKLSTIIKELTILFFDQSRIENIYIEKSKFIKGSFWPSIDDPDAYNNDYTMDPALMGPYYWDSFLIKLSTLPNAQKGLSRLESLHCDGCLPSEFFYGLADMCPNIKEIGVECGCSESQGLVALVKAQKNGLESFSFNGNGIDKMPSLVNALSNKVNTLKHLKFSGYYKIPLTIFAKSPLKTLTIEGYERVRKEYLDPLTLNPVQKLWKLKLILVGSPIEPLVTIIRNSGSTLQEIYLQWQYVYNSFALFDSITKNCSQLKSLKIPVNSKTILLLDEITHSNPHLKKLVLLGDTIPGHKIDISEGIIKLANSGFIPKKLEYLHFGHDVMLEDVDALDIFFSKVTRPLRFEKEEHLFEKKFTQKYDDIIAKYSNIRVAPDSPILRSYQVL